MPTYHWFMQKKNLYCAQGGSAAAKQKYRKSSNVCRELEVFKFIIYRYALSLCVYLKRYTSRIIYKIVNFYHNIVYIICALCNVHFI